MTTNQKYWVFIGIACALLPNNNIAWLDFGEAVVGVGFFVAAVRNFTAEDKESSNAR